MSIYVAADGNWGDANGLVIIDDDNLTQEDLEELSNSTDGDRVDFARQLLIERTNKP